MVVVEGKIKGKARPRFNTKTGRAFTPGDTITYENWIKCCYQEQDGKFIDGPVSARIEVYYKVIHKETCTSHKRWVRNAFKETR